MHVFFFSLNIVDCAILEKILKSNVEEEKLQLLDICVSLL